MTGAGYPEALRHFITDFKVSISQNNKIVY